ncbi:MAG TPA: hypothetical protein PLC99_14175 [Verrucomicrobiota bacterium]|nr:hypothetical protein [Verrucomicrobiota bacterium]
MELHVARMQIPNGASMNLAPTHFINGVEDKVEAHKELLRRVVDKQ